MLVNAGSLWQRTVEEVARSSPTSRSPTSHVDAASMFFVTDPGRFDVVVTDNLFGDILTDLGAAIAGGIGLAASGNLDVSRANPSMFEPVHGSAPDIAGQGKADPTATALSVAMLLDHLGHWPSRPPGSSRPSRPTWPGVPADRARSTSQIGGRPRRGRGGLRVRFGP